MLKQKIHLGQLDKMFILISPKRKLLAKLRAKWKESGNKNCSQASRYFDLKRDNSIGEFVDDKTWLDLEFPKIFSLIDTTESPIGSQVLYRKIRKFQSSQHALSEQYSTYDTLRVNSHLREEMQLQLMHLDLE